MSGGAYQAVKTKADRVWRIETTPVQDTEDEFKASRCVANETANYIERIYILPGHGTTCMVMATRSWGLLLFSQFTACFRRIFETARAMSFSVLLALALTKCLKTADKYLGVLQRETCWKVYNQDTAAGYSIGCIAWHLQQFGRHPWIG